MTLSLEEIPPLSADSRTSAKALTRALAQPNVLAPNRRQFISAVAAGGLAVGGAFRLRSRSGRPRRGRPARRLRRSQAGSGPQPVRGRQRRTQRLGDVLLEQPQRRRVRPEHDLQLAHLPRWVCHGVYHRYYWPGGDDAWKYRPDQCPPNTSYDRWKWFRSNYAGCSQAIINCHDGWKVVDGKSYPTIRAGFMGCA